MMLAQLMCAAHVICDISAEHDWRDVVAFAITALALLNCWAIIYGWKHNGRRK